MRRFKLAAALALVLLALTPVAAQAAFDVDFAARLQGESEVPPVQTAASGHAVFDVIETGDGQLAIRYALRVERIDNVTAAHIHLAPPGQNGPIVVTLFSGGPTGPVDGVLARGIIRRGDLEGPLAGESLARLIREMQAGNTYVNVHTTDHPTGEIRGQIRQVSDIP